MPSIQLLQALGLGLQGLGLFSRVRRSPLSSLVGYFPPCIVVAAMSPSSLGRGEVGDRVSTYDHCDRIYQYRHVSTTYGGGLSSPASRIVHMPDARCCSTYLSASIASDCTPPSPNPKPNVGTLPANRCARFCSFENKSLPKACQNHSQYSKGF